MSIRTSRGGNVVLLMNYDSPVVTLNYGKSAGPPLAETLARRGRKFHVRYAVSVHLEEPLVVALDQAVSVGGQDLHPALAPSVPHHFPHGRMGPCLIAVEPDYRRVRCLHHVVFFGDLRAGNSHDRLASFQLEVEWLTHVPHAIFRPTGFQRRPVPLVHG